MRGYWLLVLCGFLANAAGKPGFDELSRMIRSNSRDLAEGLRGAMGDENLKKGTAHLSQGPDFIFAIESSAKPLLVIDETPSVAPLRKAAQSSIWFGTAKLKTGALHSFHYLLNNARFGGRTDVPAFGPYSYEKPGVPKGTLNGKFTHTSRIYPEMKSDYWVYVPAQFDPAKPAAVMVWQDGEVLVPRELPSRAQIVFDNLTHEGKIPVIVQVLISPGVTGQRRMRSIQYDTVNDIYTRFLLEEILPEVDRKWPLRKDGYSRAIAGDSSGGICAFNAAWQKPDQFSRVLSRIGSFTSIQWRPGQLDGGNVYPFKIRKEPKRNIRVWLQDGAGDLENDHGSWPLQNVQMANSLKLKGYDFHFSWGEGTHNRNGGHVELAEEMIWLWRDYAPDRTDQVFEMEAAEREKPMFRIKALNRE